MEVTKENLKKKIMAIIENRAMKNRLYSFSEIKKRLGNINLKSTFLQEALSELEEEGAIMITDKGYYRSFPIDLGYAQGKIVIDEIGNGYVDVSVTESNGLKHKIVYKVNLENLNDALIGDIVLIKDLGDTSKGHPLAKVEKIIKRNTGLVFCNVVNINGKLVLEPETLGFRREILLRKKDLEKLREGDRLLISLDDLVGDDYYIGSISSEHVEKGDSKKVVREAKRRKEYEDAKILCEIEAPIFIDGHMDGVITLDDGNVAIVDPKYLQDALDGDIVNVQVFDLKRNGCYVAHVMNIVERKNKPVTCDVKKGKNGLIELIPCGVSLANPVILDRNSTDKLLTEGDRIRVYLGEFDKRYKAVVAKFDSYIGNKNQTLLDLRTIAIEHGINPDFTEAALAESRKLPRTVFPEEIKGRLDLRDELIFSIDDETCKDRDDAISIKLLPNGNFEAGIHISDVSHYIHPGMALWNEAKQRSTSSYLCFIVFAMLPKIISNGICSLDEGLDRLTLSTIVELTPDGEIVNYKFVDSVIRSKKAMTYTAVNQILEEGIVPEGYEDYVESLELWDRLSKVLEKQKIKRGYIEFGSNEIKASYDNAGNVVKISKRINGSGQKIIENAMLLNGQCYAQFMDGMTAPYRVHDEPDAEKLEQAVDTLSRSGIRVVNVEEVIDGKKIEKILKGIKDQDVRTVAATILLRAMKLARYDSKPGYHFGLALDRYGQFTSPIRRFMDLLAHYLLKMKRDNKIDWSRIDQLNEEIDEMCKHSTIMERRADEAERDADYFDMTRYVESHMEQKYPSQVTYINSKGIYIKTREGIDGKIRSVDVPGLHLMYDESTASYRDRRLGVTIRIGDRLIATALGTHEEYKTINFGIAEEDVGSVVTLKNKKRV